VTVTGTIVEKEKLVIDLKLVTWLKTTTPASP
jgi:hypothetical protein